MKIWAKTYRGEKILVGYIYESDGKFSRSSFYSILTEICEHLDLPTPVVLKMHEEHFDKFNIVRFRRSDFVESVDFDTFTLEHVVEKEKKQGIRNDYL